MATIAPLPGNTLIEMSKTNNPGPVPVLQRQLVIAEPKNTTAIAAAAVIAPHGASSVLTLDATSSNPHVGNLLQTTASDPTVLPATGISATRHGGSLVGTSTQINPTVVPAILTVNKAVPLIGHVATPPPGTKNINPRNRNRCPHNRRKRLCKDCGGSAYCVHGRQKHRCKECGSFCKHGRNKYCCKECGGASFCKHARRKQYCKLCGGTGNALCTHGKRKSRCKICGGSAYCVHGKRKDGCRKCNPQAFCLHRRLKRRCKECGGASQCWHGRYKHLCKECNGSPKKRGPPRGARKTAKKLKNGNSQPRTPATATVVAISDAKAVSAVPAAIPTIITQAPPVPTSIISASTGPTAIVGHATVNAPLITRTATPAAVVTPTTASATVVTPQILRAITTTAIPAVVPISSAASIAVAINVTTATAQVTASQLDDTIVAV